MSCVEVYVDEGLLDYKYRLMYACKLIVVGLGQHPYRVER